MAAQCFHQAAPQAPLAFLLTRPAPASARFADALRESFGPGAQVVISPLMAAEFLQPALPPGPFDAVILTSETGVEATRRLSADPGWLPHRAFCVGDRTTEAATAAGFQAQSAKGDATTLLTLIAASTTGLRLLHLRGRESTGDIVQQLGRMGFYAQEAVVYQQQPQPLSAPASTLLAGVDPVIVPLFSPRSADLLAQSGAIRAPLWIAALSPAVASRAQALNPQRLVVATHPDAQALMQAVECLCAAGTHT